MKKTPEQIQAALKQSQINKAIKIEEDALHKELLADAKAYGVGVVHVFNELNPMGGLTIAFRKAEPNQTSTNMVEVAVATCSYSDNFSRKIGTTFALEKFFSEMTILLPLAAGYEDEDLAGSVKRKFSALYFTF